MKQYTPKDFGRSGEIKNIILKHPEEFKKFVDPYVVGRKKKEWCQAVYSKFTKILVETIVEHVMESDRIQTASGRYWDIGVNGMPTKHLNWHTDGKSYGLRISGMGDVKIRMSKKNRKELEYRIMNGQTFHQ